MMSVVCVYNNEDTLELCLLDSLYKQKMPCEIITVNNTKNIYKSAAVALNYGAGCAKGDYIIFAHQDIIIDNVNWLSEVEEIIKGLPDLGIAGVAGSIDGQIFGHIISSDNPWGNALNKPVEVQTLDECLVIIPKKIFLRMQFDYRTFDGWHCYAADYALSVVDMGLRAYVIPAFLEHVSAGLNIKNMPKYFLKLYLKHYKMHKHIYVAGDGCEITPSKIIKMYLSPIYRKIKAKK